MFLTSSVYMYMYVANAKKLLGIEWPIPLLAVCLIGKRERKKESLAAHPPPLPLQNSQSRHLRIDFFIEYE